MIGVGNALGMLVIISILLLFYIPVITTIILSKLGMLESTKKTIKLGKYLSCFIITGLITLFLIRSFPYVMINPLIVYSILSTLAVLTSWIINKIRVKNLHK
jgi:hypothetical protein